MLILWPGRASINHGQVAVPIKAAGSSADTILARYPVDSWVVTAFDVVIDEADAMAEDTSVASR